MEINNFKKLEEIEFENISMRSDVVRNNIGANLGAMRFLTDIVELYFPRVVDLFVGLTGGEPGHIDHNDSRSTRSKYPDMG